MSEREPAPFLPPKREHYPELLGPFNSIFEKLTSPDQQLRPVKVHKNYSKKQTIYQMRLSTDDAWHVSQEETADAMAVQVAAVDHNLSSMDHSITVEVLHGRHNQARFIDTYRLYKSGADNDDYPPEVTFIKHKGQIMRGAADKAGTVQTTVDMAEFEPEFTRILQLEPEDLAVLTRLQNLLAE